MEREDDVARSLECRQCGNRIALEQLGPAVRCPYCHAEQAVDAALLEQAATPPRAARSIVGPM